MVDFHKGVDFLFKIDLRLPLLVLCLIYVLYTQTLYCMLYDVMIDHDMTKLDVPVVLREPYGLSIDVFSANALRRE